MPDSSREDASNVHSIADIRASVEAYPQYIPPQLEELDPLRYEGLPSLLKQRRASNGSAYLEKDEVVKLVEWKLKHGKFRPNLLKLVSSNSASAILDATKTAFTIEDPLKALDVLTKLSGIGPATASLLLSVNDPAHVPFFSDELFRWIHLENNAKGVLIGWDRKIAYNKKEYASMYSKCVEMLEKLNMGKESSEVVSMLDLERHAYVLNARRGEKQEKTQPTKRKIEEAENHDNDTKTVKPQDGKRPKRSRKVKESG